MIAFLYNILISLSSLIFSILSWVKPKWKLRSVGLRKQKISTSKIPRLWFHCASAGEYEQIGQVIEFMKEKLPENPVFISFFSPSGIEWMQAKNIPYEHAYLPFDQRSKMKSFIKQVNPLCAVIAKNEFWVNMLNELNNASVPTFMVSAKVSKNFIGIKNRFFKKHLTFIQTIFCQDSTSKKILSEFHPNILESGDTRISQILSKISTQKQIDLPFDTKRPFVVYGSLHKEDAEVLHAVKKFPLFNHIIVPHDVSSKSISDFTHILGPNPPLSNKKEKINGNFVIINEMGKLASLYQLSDYAYVGGGFSKGIHNIMEPLVHNNMVSIGTNYKTFQEAVELVKENALEVLSHPSDFCNFLENSHQLTPTEKENRQIIVRKFIELHKNAAFDVSKNILKYLSIK